MGRSAIGGAYMPAIWRRPSAAGQQHGFVSRGIRRQAALISLPPCRPRAVCEESLNRDIGTTCSLRRPWLACRNLKTQRCRAASAHDWKPCEKDASASSVARFSRLSVSIGTHVRKPITSPLARLNLEQALTPLPFTAPSLPDPLKRMLIRRSNSGEKE